MDLLSVLSSLPLGAVAGWFVGRQMRRVREQKEVHDTYREMYMDLRQTLKDLEDENRRMSRSVGRLEKAVSRMVYCPHVELCPAIDELRGQEYDFSSGGKSMRCASAGECAEQG